MGNFFRFSAGLRAGGPLKVKCPHCGFIFDVSYSRIMYCKTCPFGAFGDCDKIKCPRCQEEFTLYESEI